MPVWKSLETYRMHLVYVCVFLEFYSGENIDFRGGGSWMQFKYYIETMYPFPTHIYTSYLPIGLIYKCQLWNLRPERFLPLLSPWIFLLCLLRNQRSFWNSNYIAKRSYLLKLIFFQNDKSQE